MRTKQTNENLRRTFHTDLRGIFIIAGFRNSFFKYGTTRIPAVLSPVVLVSTYVFNVDPYSLIIEVNNRLIEFLPGILGFTIAGYSLMVGFIQAGVLNKITEPMSDTNYSLYQRMSATFAVNILLQGFALCLGFLIHFVMFFDTHAVPSINPSAAAIVNYATLGIICYWFLISLLMVLQIVVNIFSFSQLHHYFVNKEKLDLQTREQAANAINTNKPDSEIDKD